VRALTLEVPAGSLADSGSSRGVLAIVAAGAVARLALAAVVPITVDEAYYVDWARHLQPGYLDHPPLVAWLLAVPLRLLGPSAAAVRLPAILLQAGTTLLAASLALAFAWAGALWSVERAFRLHRSWFLAAGAFLGLAALSKLTAGLLGLALLAALAATPDGRRALAGPWPWAGAVIALAVASPMLAWNAVHGWPSFAFQLAHGARGRSFSALDLARSIGAQAGYVSPLLLVLAAGAALRALPAPRSPAIAGLAFSAAPVIALFTAAAAFTPGALPHWPAPGWLSACVLLSVAGGRLLRPALVVGFAAIAALLLFLLAPLPLPAGPLDELRGGRALAPAAEHWIVLGQIGWYDRASPAYLGERRSGPTFYEPDPRAAGAPLLLVTVEGLDPGREALEARLGPLVPAGGFVATEAERTIRRFRFWRLSPRERG